MSPPVGEPQGNVSCEGVIPNVSVDNIVVPSGAVCTLAGTQVRGGVLAEPGSTIHLGSGTSVRGTVEVKEGARYTGFRPTIGGNLKCDRCRPGSLNGPFIGGSVQVVGALEAFNLFFGEVGGGLEIVGTTAGPEFPRIALHQSTIRGSVKLEKNQRSLNVTSLVIGGDLQVIENADYVFAFNMVGGNMQVFKNQGAGPSSIDANSIGGSLQCKENEPPPLGFLNFARETEGQCRFSFSGS